MDRTGDQKLDDYNIDTLLNFPSTPLTSSTVDDATAIAELLGRSRRISNDIVVTVMSGLDDNTLSLKQELYDVLAKYIGKRYSAKRLEAYADSKFRIEHGAFLIFRNLRDPGSYVNIIIDTDRRILRGFKRINRTVILTTDDRRVNVDRLRRLVIRNNNDRDDRVLLDTITPVLESIQEMMNTDQIGELYNYLGVRIERRWLDDVTTRDEQRIRQRVSV